MQSLGIMQGRMVPRYKNRYQAFPINYWKAEFHIARELGLSSIEFILDYNDIDTHPLMTDKGLEEIKQVMEESSVKVLSICADYFMQFPFHGSDQNQSEEILKKLISNASMLGVKDIVIPCVDASTLKTEDDKKKLVNSMSKHLALAEEKNIFINFETDLSPATFKDLIKKFESKNIKVNYDIGNSASLGYNPEEELNAYGEFISDLHVKDRILGGKSVPLGTGNAKIERVFQLLKELDFKGLITMQAARADKFEDEFTLLRNQIDYTKTLMKKYLNSEKL